MMLVSPEKYDGYAASVLCPLLVHSGNRRHRYVIYGSVPKKQDLSYIYRSHVPSTNRIGNFGFIPAEVTMESCHA